MPHAPGKPPWPASSIRMFGSCDPPFTLPHSPVPLYARPWGSNGRASQPERDLPPRSECSRQLLAQWQDPRRCVWCAGVGGEVAGRQAGLGLPGPAVLPSGNALADQAGSRHKHSVPGARAPGSLCSSPEVGTPLPGSCSQRAVPWPGQGRREGERGHSRRRAAGWRQMLLARCPRGLGAFSPGMWCGEPSSLFCA